MSKTQKTQPPAKRKRASARDGFLTQKSPDEEDGEKNQSDGISARREKTHWYLTRRALAFANAAVMTDARRAFVETPVRIPRRTRAKKRAPRTPKPTEPTTTRSSRRRDATRRSGEGRRVLRRRKKKEKKSPVSLKKSRTGPPARWGICPRT